MFAATRGRGGSSASVGDADTSWRRQNEGDGGWRSPTTSPRGAYRGRLRRGIRGTTDLFGVPRRYVEPPQPPERDILEGLLPGSVETMTIPQPMNIDEVRLRDVTYLASYTWLDSQQPTIVVPGSPRLWREPTLPVLLPPDSGTTYADSNGHRIPRSPLLPLFLAVDTMEEDPQVEKLDWNSVDFVTDRNNLRKLLAFIDREDGVPADFRIDLQLAGLGTVIMQRWESRPMLNASGWGDTFEREMTSPGPGCERGTLAGHHRVVTYELAGMKFVLRCEVDACFDDIAPSTSDKDAAHKVQDDPDDLIETFASLTVATNADDGVEESSRLDTASEPTVHVIKGGAVVPQSSLIKVKTRSQWNAQNFNWQSIWPQLFLGQTYNLFLGVHTKGKFTEVRKTKVDDEELREVTKKAQYSLKRMGQLLQDIHYKMMGSEGSAGLTLVCQKGELRFFKRAREDSLLPANVLDRFDL